jgi:carboxyl-terminal processing protease
LEVPSGSVAERAGLKPDDRLVAIDGKPVAGQPSEQIRNRLSGEVGSTVKLEVMRGPDRLELTIERAPYRPPPAR